MDPTPTLIKTLCTPPTANQVTIGQLYLDALIARILLTDLNVPEQRRDQLNTNMVREAVENVMQGVAVELIAVVIGRLYAGIAKNTNYAQALQQIIAGTIKHMREDSRLSSVNQEQFSEFELTTSKIGTEPHSLQEPPVQVPTSQPVQQPSPQTQTPKNEELSLPFLLQISEIKPAPEPAIQMQGVQSLHEVDAYLMNIAVYRSEINLVSQLMKLPSIRYYRFKYSDRYYVQASLQISCTYTRYQQKQFNGEGYSAIYKQACDQAAYQVLRTLYISYPELWRRFMCIKNKKGLT